MTLPTGAMDRAPEITARPSGGAGRQALAFVGYLAVAVLLHAWLGGFQSDHGAFEDEPAHLVTALMLRDWFASGALLEPRAFVEAYYVHYPKVGLGQWPPVLHGALGVWMLVFGTTAVSIGLFLCTISALVAVTVQRVLSGPLGHAASTAAGAAYLAVPVALGLGQSVMTETMIALLGLHAALAFGRFLDGGSARDAMGFAVLAALTILTKGSGLALALVPPVALLLSARHDLLRRPALWGAGALVAAITAPWYLLTLGFSQGTWAGGASPSLRYVAFAAGEYAGWLPALTGLVGLGLVPLGVMASRRGLLERGRWAALVAWAAGLGVLHLVVPSSVEERHLAVLAPVWVVFTALGVAAATSGLARAAGRAPAPRLAAGGVLALAALPFALGEPLPRKDWSGWGAAAREVVSGGHVADRILVASDPVGEGMLVAGVALAEEHRPSRMVLRASKVLGDAGWSGRDYRPRFSSVGAIEAFVADLGVGVIVIDESAEGGRHWYEHMEQLRLLVARGGWREVRAHEVVRGGRSSPSGGIRVYVAQEPPEGRRRPVELHEVLR